MRADGALLGLLAQDPAVWFRWQPAGRQAIGEAEIEALIARRLAARKAKDFKEADRIRGDYKRDTAVNMERFKKVFNALRDRRDAVRAQYGIGTPFRHLNGARGKPTRGTGEDECRTEEVSSET